MAEIAGVYCASHTPVMLNFPDRIPDDVRTEIFGAYEAMGKAFVADRPDALVLLTNDHVHNFFLDNFPAFCIGCAEQYDSPVEHWLKTDKRMLPGNQELGSFLLQKAYEANFDPSFSMELTLDHGVVTPLAIANIIDRVTVVPVLINCVQPPMPTMDRCFQLGRFIGDAIKEFDGVSRVAVLATGGISHDIATPRMGMVNEEFDLGFIELMEAGDDEGAVRYATENVHLAGNGGEEVRMWLAAMGVVRGLTFSRSYYRAVNDWYTGIGIGRFA